MRVALIAPPWVAVPPPAYGGTERVLDELCRGLAAEGHDVLLVATGDSTSPVERSWTYETALGTERAAPLAELRHVVDGYRAAAEWRADIVHDHTLAGPLLGPDRTSAPVLTTNHGPFEGDLAAFYREVARRVPVLAISHHQASTAEGTPIEAVIHHGVDVAAHPIGAGRGGYALFLGRMNPDKGVHTAIRVARAAGLPLRIAAKMREPDERAYFEAEVEPHLGGDVEYVGEVGGADKLALLADAVCLLNPIAWAEPFGMVMIEALACGTPVVATPLGAASEIVDDGATGFLRRDEASLVRAVADVASLDRGACRAAAEARFSTKRMVAEHLEVYERLAGANLRVT